MIRIVNMKCQCKQLCIISTCMNAKNSSASTEFEASASAAFHIFLADCARPVDDLMAAIPALISSFVSCPSPSLSMSKKSASHSVREMSIVPFGGGGGGTGSGTSVTRISITRSNGRRPSCRLRSDTIAARRSSAAARQLMSSFIERYLSWKNCSRPSSCPPHCAISPSTSRSLLLSCFSNTSAIFAAISSTLSFGHTYFRSSSRISSSSRPEYSAHCPSRSSVSKSSGSCSE